MKRRTQWEMIEYLTIGVFIILGILIVLDLITAISKKSPKNREHERRDWNNFDKDD